MIIRNKHNLSHDEISVVNKSLSKTWLKDIYNITAYFSKDSLCVNHLSLGNTENSILYIEDLIRAMKKTLNNGIYKKCMFEFTFIDPNLDYNNIKAGALKFVMKDGVLLKYISSLESLPFKNI